MTPQRNVSRRPIRNVASTYLLALTGTSCFNPFGASSRRRGLRATSPKIGLQKSRVSLEAAKDAVYAANDIEKHWRDKAIKLWICTLVVVVAFTKKREENAYSTDALSSKQA